MSPMLTAGIDHVGLTVPALSQAITTIQGLLNGGLCYIEGPIEEPEPGWMARKLGASQTFTLHVAAMNVGGVNLELFEYAGGHGMEQARPDEGLDGFALLIGSAVFVNDVSEADITAGLALVGSLMHQTNERSGHQVKASGKAREEEVEAA